MGGWGNGYGGYGNGGGAVTADVQRGFDQAAVTSGINGLSTGMCNGFAAVQQSLCNGFAGVTGAVTNGFAQAEISANARQIADMNQNFNSQIATLQGFNTLGSQLAQCCCDNRLATCQTQNLVQSEGAATRLTIQNQTQAIIDKLCQLELDNLKQDNANLRTQLNMANLQASQVAQTAELRQSGATQLNQLVNELRSCPIPAQPVYGSQPIFTCGNNNYGTCGCGA